MAAPLAGIPASAAQVAQQKVQEQGTQQVAKEGPSKFDQAMANKSQPAGAPQGVGGAQAPGGVQEVRQVGALERSILNKLNAHLGGNALTTKGATPVAQKQDVNRATAMISQVVTEIEKGQGALDKLISSGVAGKNMSMPQMLALQAGMYKYTQELDLTGKVVERATTGLKDTLKTQV